uniref:uncharacterized protein isoform X1 n=1 Tax=Myxine glutinosa TaxID=7769 RepID=UPI00358E9383
MADQVEIVLFCLLIILYGIWNRMWMNRINSHVHRRKRKRYQQSKLWDDFQDLEEELGDELQYESMEKRRRLHMNKAVHAFVHAQRTHSLWTHLTSSDWWDRVACNFTDAQWVENFRMSRETFDYICHNLTPVLQRSDTRFRLCIPVRKRVAVALWKLATNAKYRSVGHLFGVGRSTVCKCVQEVCKAITEILMPIHIPIPSAEHFAEIAEHFEQVWEMPQCVGAIDCTHIPIIAPQEYHYDYVNKKDWHSVVLQVVVDGQSLFWDLCAGFAGSANDSHVIRHSKLWTLASAGNLLPPDTKRIAGQDVGYYIIGGSAYPLQTWLMRPIPDRGRLTNCQHQYNLKLRLTRSVIEDAFKRLKGRWRCLLKRNDCDLHLVVNMITSCCVLHNLCEEHQDDFHEEWLIDKELAQPVHVLPETCPTEGNSIRDALVEYLSL